MIMAEREDTGFKVTDRRKFKADGSPRDEAENPEQAAPDERAAASAAADITPQVNQPEPHSVNSAPVESTQPPQSSSSSRVDATPVAPNATAQAAAPEHDSAGHAERAYNQARGPQSSQMPEASFLGLVNMLGVEAAMHMGLIQAPGEEAPSVDLESARHLIDILGILQTKTRGNLTAEEDNLFEGMLADLRMQFVALSRKQ
jgi:hypothetical protein